MERPHLCGSKMEGFVDIQAQEVTDYEHQSSAKGLGDLGTRVFGDFFSHGVTTIQEIL